MSLATDRGSVTIPVMGERFIFAAWADSATYATAGVLHVLRTQRAVWLHILIYVLIFGLAWAVRLPWPEWRWLVAGFALVVVTETMNTAFEHLCDVVSPDHHDGVKFAKDVAAGAVLLSGIGGWIVALMTIGPRLLSALGV